MKIYIPAMCKADLGKGQEYFQNHFESLGSPDCQVVWEPAERGAAAIESIYDQVMCLPWLVQKIEGAEAVDFDAGLSTA